MRARPLVLALIAAGSLACASATRNEDGTPTGRSFSNVITHEELINSAVLGLNTYDAIQRLRPGYLMNRTAGRRGAAQLQISINGGQLTSLSSLNSIPASTVNEIRYMDNSEAQERFGSRANGPVILVQLMTPTSP